MGEPGAVDCGVGGLERLGTRLMYESSSSWEWERDIECEEYAYAESEGRREPW